MHIPTAVNLGIQGKTRKRVEEKITSNGTN